MASILKVDKLDPQSGTALEIGTSGDTISVPSGATLDISSATLTPPATLPASSGVNLTALNATNLGSGTVPTARLGSGTASSSVFLRGDSSWTAPAGGITVADQWRLTTSLTATTGSDQVFTTNLEQVDTGGQGTLGSAMTESSGVFTFPSTGIYLVEYGIYTFDNVDTYWCTNKIWVTINDSSYAEIARGATSMTGEEGLGDNPGKMSYINSLVDVTDTSNVKVKFGYKASATISVKGYSAINSTFFTFTRLGDT